MSESTRCWACGKKLAVFRHKVLFQTVYPHGENSEGVRVHTVCAETMREGGKRAESAPAVRSEVRKYLEPEQTQARRGTK